MQIGNRYKAEKRDSEVDGTIATRVFGTLKQAGWRGAARGRVLARLRLGVDAGVVVSLEV